MHEIPAKGKVEMKNIIELPVDPRVKPFYDKIVDLLDDHMRDGRITYTTAIGVLEQIKLELFLESME